MTLIRNIADFETISGVANGATTEANYWGGGEKTIAIYSNHASENKWDGGTIKIQASLANADTGWITLTDGEGSDLSFTEDSIFKLSIGKCKVRFVLSGVSGTDVDLVIKVS